MNERPKHRRLRTRIASLGLTAAMALGLIAQVLPARVSAQQATGNAPFINTWLVSGPFEENVAAQIYGGQGLPVERPADGNWARLATASATSVWQTNAYDFPSNSPASQTPEKAIDGDKGTEWISQMHDTAGGPDTWPVWDPEPTFWLEWRNPVPIRYIYFYDRHNPAWPEGVSNIPEVRCTLFDENGEQLGETITVTEIDDYGVEPGVADFGQEYAAVAKAELKIIYEGKTYENIGLGFTEVEAYDAEGPSDPGDGEGGYDVNLAPAATATASTALGANPPSNVNDGQDAQWVTGENDPTPWVMLTWDEPVTFNEIDLKQWGDLRHVNETYDFTFTFADGGTSTAHFESAQDKNTTDIWEADSTLYHVKSLKVEVDKGLSGFNITGISEIEVYYRQRYVFDVNLTSGAQVTVSSNYSDANPPEYLIDGSTKKQWVTKDGGVDTAPWAMLTWDEPISFNEVTLAQWGDGRHVNQWYDLTVTFADETTQEFHVDADGSTSSKPAVWQYDGYLEDVVSIKVDVDKGRDPYPAITGISEMEVYCREYKGDEPLPPEEPDPEIQVTPVVGEAFGTADGESHSWEYFDDRIYNRNYDDYQDLAGYFTTRKGIDTKNKFVYAHTYVYSPERQRAQLRIGASGSYCVYLNDVLLNNPTEPALVQKDMSCLDVVLKAGWNKVLVQIEHTFTDDISGQGAPGLGNQDFNVAYLGFYGRVTNSKGDALDGVFSSVAGGEAEQLSIVSQGLQSEETSEEGLGLPDGNMPVGYREWPYVWNKSTTGNLYGLAASAFQFQAAGGTAPYTWEIVEGSLPDNLELLSTGVIADGLVNGKPDLNSTKGIIPMDCALGDFTFTVQVTDAAGQTAQKEFTITVKERPNKWFEEGRVGALSHCIAIPLWEVDPNFSADLWAQRAKEQGHSLVSIESGQQHYYWPSKFDDPTWRNQWYEVDGKTPDGLKVFEEAVKRYGMKFGLYYPGRGTDIDYQDIADLIERYDPDYFYFDGPQAFPDTNNFDVTYSNIRNYSDEIIVNSNAWDAEYGDPDLGTAEASGIYANVGSNYFVKKVVFEPWKSLHTKNNYTPYYAKRDDYRQVVKEMIMNAGRGLVDNNDQMPLMSRGVNWDSPEDVATRYPISIQEFIDVRENHISWFAPEGLPERHEATTGTTPYFLTSDCGSYQDDGRGNYEYFAHPNINQTPKWGYAMARDNNLYLHIIEGPDSKQGFGAIQNNTLTIAPVEGTVESVTWLNQDLPVAGFTQQGDTLTIDLSNVTEDPIDTIIKITTDSAARKYKLTDLYLEGKQLSDGELQIVTEGYMTYPALRAKLERVTYASDSQAVRVDQTGKVTYASDGTANITVTAVYEGVTVSDTIAVKATDGKVYIGEKMLSAVLHVNDREVYGELYGNDEANLYVEGRAETGGPIGLANGQIVWHTGTVDLDGGTKEEAIQIDENQDAIAVSGGKLTLKPVEQTTRAVVWADVTLDGVTVTTNRVYLDILPQDNLAKDAVITASVNQEAADLLKDGKTIEGINMDASKWSAPAGEENTVDFTFAQKQPVTGLQIHFNTLNQSYYNTPKSFTVQTSEDGETWTDVKTFNGPTGGAYFGYADQFNFDASIETAHLRLVVNQGNGANIDLLEVEILGEDLTPEQPTVNKDALQALYNAHKNKPNDNYTAASWQAFQAALEQAKAVLDDADASQADVDAAAAALAKAVEGLKQKPGAQRPATPSQPDEPAREALPFHDVSEAAWYYDAVEYVYAQGLMDGTGEGVFSPDATTTRAMIVTILYRLEGEPRSAATGRFSDVAAGQWYTDAVEWAAANEIVNGYADGRFGPTDAITREQLAAILYRYAAYRGCTADGRADLAQFSDAETVSAYAAEPMEWAVGQGLINGSNNALLPGSGATRAQVAAILMRFCEEVG